MLRALAAGTLAVTLAATATGCGCDGTEVRVVSADGDEVLQACADRAITEDERRQGLMGREDLDPGEGLLITFPVEGEVCIVNRGVAFAIDVVYADEAGAVVAIERNIPADDATARCHAPVRNVLELPAGQASEITVNDELRF